MLYIRDNFVVVVENLTIDGFTKRKASGTVISSMRELSFSPVEPNDLKHRTRVPSWMSPKEPTYTTTRDSADLPSEAL